MSEPTETQKAIWTTPQATHIDTKRTLFNLGSLLDGPGQENF